MLLRAKAQVQAQPITRAYLELGRKAWEHRAIQRKLRGEDAEEIAMN